MVGLTDRAVCPWAREVGQKPVFSTSALIRKMPPPWLTASSEATFTRGKSEARWRANLACGAPRSASFAAGGFVTA